MARLSARSLMKHAVETDNMELASLVIIAGGLELLHEFQAYQPISIKDRARMLRDFARDATQNPTPRPVPVRA